IRHTGAQAFGRVRHADDHPHAGRHRDYARVGGRPCRTGLPGGSFAAADRSVLGLSLMMGQAFLYNAIFFTYALVLTTFYRVDNSKVGLYLIPFAIGNVLGP